MSYSSALKKNATVTYGSGKSTANHTYIVQKASGSTYGSATSAINDNRKLNGVQYSNKFDVKINSHLLDHGYGATPQPTYDPNSSRCSVDNGDASGNFKGYTSSTDAGITKYYKVSEFGTKRQSNEKKNSIKNCRKLNLPQNNHI